MVGPRLSVGSCHRLRQRPGIREDGANAGFSTAAAKKSRRPRSRSLARVVAAVTLPTSSVRADSEGHASRAKLGATVVAGGQCPDGPPEARGRADAHLGALAHTYRNATLTASVRFEGPLPSRYQAWKFHVLPGAIWPEIGPLVPTSRSKPPPSSSVFSGRGR